MAADGPAKPTAPARFCLQLLRLYRLAACAPVPAAVLVRPFADVPAGIAGSPPAPAYSSFYLEAQKPALCSAGFFMEDVVNPLSFYG